MESVPMRLNASLRLWAIFSARMVADVCGMPVDAAEAKLDALATSGKLHRWEQRGVDLPNVYYLT